MATYKILSTGNSILADQSFVDQYYPNDYELQPEPTPPEDINAWWIYVGPFYDRFGDQKWPILASTIPMVGALIKDCSVRKYIDLKRADLPAALDILIAAGFTIDKTAILTTPVPMDDRFIG